MALELELAAIALVIALPLTFILRLPTKAGRVAAHARIPRIGGFAIVTAFVLAPPLGALFSEPMRGQMEHEWDSFAALAVCGGVVFFIGALDDFRDIRWTVRLAVQVAAASALYMFGFRVSEMTLPGGGHIELGFVDPFLTILWIVFMTNAMNFLDGHDGVAPGVAALVAGTMTIAARDLGHNVISVLFATLAGASLAVVPLNLPPARRFLGDSGAYFLGFTLAGLSVAGFLDDSGRVPLYIPVVALGLPVLEMGISVLRRVLDGRPPMQADQDHFHDRLARKLGPLKVALTTYLITAGFCGSALLLLRWYKSEGSALVGAVVLVAALALVVLFGYARTMWESVRKPSEQRDVVRDSS